MKVINKSGNGLCHSLYIKDVFTTFYLATGEAKDIPDEIAAIWLNLPGVEKYIDQADLEKAEREAKAKAEAEKKELEAKNKALEAQLEAMKKEAKPATKAKAPVKKGKK